MLGGHNSRMKWKYKDYMRVPGVCNITTTSTTTTTTTTTTTLRFYGVGKKFLWGRLPRMISNLNTTLQVLNSSDVVVFNMGLHWTQSCHRQYRVANKEYAKELLSLEVLLDRDIRLCQSTTTTTTPLLIWRETFPQHFPTSNGLYPDGQRFHGMRISFIMTTTTTTTTTTTIPSTILTTSTTTTTTANLVSCILLSCVVVVVVVVVVGDVVGLPRGEVLHCHELSSARLEGAGLIEHNACNPK